MGLVLRFQTSTSRSPSGARKAAREVREAARRRAQTVSPVVIEGRTIATTFWGKAWCDNLESYSDYANRLPRGRTYVRNGSVVDLQIKPGKITALVSGSELYNVEINIRPLPAEHVEGVEGAVRRADRLAGRAAAGQAVEERDGGRDRAATRACSPSRARSRWTAPAPTGPACASTSPR